MGRQLPTRFDTTMVAKARASQPRIPPISIGSVPSSTVGARVWTAPARAAPRSLAWRGDQPAARHGPDHAVGSAGYVTAFGSDGGTFSDAADRRGQFHQWT